MLTVEQIVAVYRQVLNRDPRDDEVHARLADTPDLQSLLRMALDSEERAGLLRQRRLEDARSPATVNVFHPDLAAWGLPPGTLSPDGVAVVGRDGWLFLCGGANANLDQHRGEAVLAPDWLEGWRAVIRRRAARAAESGLTTAFLVVPDKLAICARHFPEEREPLGPRPIELLLEADLPIVYPLEELRAAAAAGEEVYQRTDTHLTFRGNEITISSILPALGIDDPPDLNGLQFRTYPVAGDLGARFEPPVVGIVSEPRTLHRARLVEDNRAEIAAAGGHVGTRRVFRNEVAPDPRVAVVFGDSFGFAGPDFQGVSWFLAQIFREVHFVWIPFGWDPGYVREVEADVVIVQGAERFLNRVPPEKTDVREAAAETLRRARPARLPRQLIDRAGRLIRRS